MALENDSPTRTADNVYRSRPLQPRKAEDRKSSIAAAGYHYGDRPVTVR